MGKSYKLMRKGESILRNKIAIIEKRIEDS
jgi:hypothetical protein